MPDLIECDGCGRSFTTDHAVEMLAAIKGPCPSCGGRFVLAPTSAAPAARPSPAPRSTGR
jgi:rRNA maturation endonuclease Nob1